MAGDGQRGRGGGEAAGIGDEGHDRRELRMRTAMLAQQPLKRLVCVRHGEPALPARLAQLAAGARAPVGEALDHGTEIVAVRAQ